MLVVQLRKCAPRQLYRMEIPPSQWRSPGSVVYVSPTTTTTTTTMLRCPCQPFAGSATTRMRTTSHGFLLPTLAQWFCVHQGHPRSHHEQCVDWKLPLEAVGRKRTKNATKITPLKKRLSCSKRKDHMLVHQTKRTSRIEVNQPFSKQRPLPRKREKTTKRTAASSAVVFVLLPSFLPSFFPSFLPSFLYFFRFFFLSLLNNNHKTTHTFPTHCLFALVRVVRVTNTRAALKTMFSYFSLKNQG